MWCRRRPTTGPSWHGTRDGGGSCAADCATSGSWKPCPLDDRTCLSNQSTSGVFECTSAGRQQWRLLVSGLRRSGELLCVRTGTGFAAVVSSFKPMTGIGVDAVHPSVWSRISEKRKTVVHLPAARCRTHSDLAGTESNPDLLPGIQDTDRRATHRTHAIDRARMGTHAQVHYGLMVSLPVTTLRLGMQGSIGRIGGVAALSAAGGPK